MALELQQTKPGQLEIPKLRKVERPEKKEEEKKVEEKEKKLKVKKTKKKESDYELPEIEDYERPELEKYEKTDVDLSKRVMKLNQNYLSSFSAQKFVEILCNPPTLFFLYVVE